MLCGSPALAASEAESTLPPPADAPELRRELAGHNFIPSRFSLDPFVATSVATEIGFGYGTAPGHTYDLNGKPISVAAYEVGAFTAVLDYQYGFVDWWAVRASAALLAYSGLNSSGVASVGTNFVASVGLGTTVSFKVGERLRLGGSFDFSYGPSVFFNLLQSIRESIASGEDIGATTDTKAINLKPAFVGAWAIHRSLGLTFATGYTYSTTTASTGSASFKPDANTLFGNALLDFDLSGLNVVPIGFLLGFQTTFGLSSTKFLQYRYQSGIFYTGVKQLNVGVEFVYLRTPVLGATEIFLSSIQALINLQYNFN